MPSQTKLVTFWATAEVRKLLRELARRYKISQSEVLRLALLRLKVSK